MPFRAVSDEYGRWHSPSGWGYNAQSKHYLDKMTFDGDDFQNNESLQLCFESREFPLLSLAGVVGNRKMFTCFVRRDVWDHLTDTPMREELRRDFVGHAEATAAYMASMLPCMEMDSLRSQTSTGLLRKMTSFNLPSRPVAVNNAAQDLCQDENFEDAVGEIADLCTVHILLENLNRYWMPSTYAGQNNNLNKFRDWNAFLNSITTYDNIFPHLGE